MNFYLIKLMSLKKIAASILSIIIINLVLIGLSVWYLVSEGFNVELNTIGIKIIFLAIGLHICLFILAIVFTTKASAAKSLVMGISDGKSMYIYTQISSLHSNSLTATLLWIFLPLIGIIYWFIFSMIAISKISRLIAFESSAYYMMNN
ncbi:hypothetical protein [Mesomycoplasma bovoculi]|nr:hypothetical protein [Mesomycoplasma bovoculi]